MESMSKLEKTKSVRSSQKLKFLKSKNGVHAMIDFTDAGISVYEYRKFK